MSEDVVVEREPATAPVSTSWVKALDAYGSEQRRAWLWCMGRSGTLLLGDTGTGKTIISLAVIEAMRPELTVIVAPLTSLDVTWAPRLAGLGTVCRSWDEFKALRKTSTQPLILLIHFQLLAKLGTRLERVGWDLAIIDESQGIKDRASRVSRAARRLRGAGRRIALTATPLDASPIDLWAQMRFVDCSVFGDDFGSWAQRWCVQAGYKGKVWVFREQMLEEYLAALRGHVCRLTKEFLGLPPLMVRMVPVVMFGAQRRLYREMETHGIVWADDVVVPAPYPVTRKGKLEQITGGTLLDQDGHTHVVGLAKARKLGVLMQRMRPPVIIFCKFLGEIDLIRGALPDGWRVAELHGGVKDDGKGMARTELIERFQRGKVDALICQMRTGGVSISLTAASTLVFYSMNFSLIDFEQVLGRVHRPGQTAKVRVWVLHCVGTRDDEIVEEIERKGAGFYAVVDAFGGGGRPARGVG